MVSGVGPAGLDIACLQKQALKGFAKVRKTSHDCVVFCVEIEL
jgi:hypothetical protein